MQLFKEARSPNFRIFQFLLIFCVKTVFKSIVKRAKRKLKRNIDKGHEWAKFEKFKTDMFRIER